MNAHNTSPLKKRITFSIAILFVLFIAIQFVRPKIDNPPATGDFKAPTEVKNIITRACYDCHSNETNLRWYDKISPIYWEVAEHVKEGRHHLNFSNWDSLATADQKGKLWEAVNQVIAGAMPVKDYITVHPSAKISPEDLTVLKSYLLSMVHSKPADTAKTNALNKQSQTPTAFTKLPQAANGITYIPDYKNWQPISTTERFDNGTMRVIFGNDVAVKAIHDNNIHPWPNGTIFAKVAWDQLEDKDGNVTTGAFKQIEYMIKDDKKYAATKGWGWARFKTPKMIPYGGRDVLFTNECVNCHRPLKDEDFVFTMPIKN